MLSFWPVLDNGELNHEISNSYSDWSEIFFQSSLAINCILYLTMFNGGPFTLDFS